MMRVVIVLALLLVAWAVPASAEFNVAEKAEIEKIHDAGIEIRNAAQSVAADAVTVPASDARKPYALVGRELASAALASVKALGFMLNVRVTSGTVEGKAFDVSTRAQIVSRAFEGFDRVVFEIERSQGHVAALPPSANITKAQGSLRKALALVKGFNRGPNGDHQPAWLDWQPEGYPDQFAVHGDYPQAQAAVWDTINYPTRLLLGGWTAYEVGGGPAGLRELVQHLANAFDTASRVFLLSAHVGTTAVDRTLKPRDRAFLSMRLYNAPGVGVGPKFRAAQNAALDLFTSGAPEALVQLKTLSDFADGWRRVEEWNYWFMVGGRGREIGF